MPKKKASKRKTKQAAKKKTARPKYLREIHVRFKKKRVSANSPVNEPLTDPVKVVDLFKDLQNETKEKLIAISVDVRLKIITFEVVSIGSAEAVYAKPAESIRTAILVNASGLIMVHNHPSGDPKPSAADKKFTRWLTKTCETMGIPLHDHIIIGEGDSCYSFAVTGQIKRGTVR